MNLLDRPGAAALRYETYGELDTRAPIVFLNGMTQTTISWKSQARALADKIGVITYDARGQGKSIAGDTALTLELHADDLAALLDHLGVDQAHLVGFSHGARVALATANHHAERLASLTLCSATAAPTATARTILKAWRETLRLGGLEAMSWCALTAILGDKFLGQNEALIPGIIKASVQRNTEDGVRRLLDAMIEYPNLDELARGVSASTLVISGEHDVLVDHDGAKLLAELCDAEHIEVTGCGHTIPIESGAQFRSIISQFIGV